MAEAKLVKFSETFTPEGGAAGQGMRRALGRPSLDPISMLIRETVQNAWDARVNRGRSSRVTFSAMLEKCAPAEIRCLREIVFAEPPDNHPLRGELRKEFCRLILQDRGTVGLNGPAFVERAPSATDRFVNFCRMFGRASEGPVGGGTYGFGKGQCFVVSKAATIVVHTRSLEGDELLERLIGMSLWNANRDNTETGRHWWGIRDPRGRVAPAAGQRAASLAAAIGFRPFGEGETGTSIMIISPEFEQTLALDVAAKCIAESMAIWFWPRMLGGCDDEGTLAFEVSYQGKEIHVPDPTRHAPLRLYAEALRNLRGFRSGKEPQSPAIVKDVRSNRPVRRLGWLSLTLGARHPRVEHAISRIEDHAFGDQVVEVTGEPPRANHIAMMRGPGQVIFYRKCRAYPEETVEYAGVFVAGADDPEVDIAFAQSEPPSHDSWSPDEMPDETQKRFVRAALRDIGLAADAFADAGRVDLGAVAQDPLGAVSAALGELISAPGTGARRQAKPARRGGGGNRGPSRLNVVGDGGLERLEGEVVLAVPFELDAGPRVVVRANPKVLVAGGGSEGEAPAGADKPRVLGWRDVGGTVHKGTILDLQEQDAVRRWEVLVRVPADVMVGVTLELA